MRTKTVFAVSWQQGRAATAGLMHYRRGHTVSSSSRTPDELRAQWDWDGTTLTARTDRYGLHPIYYVREGQRFAVATNPLDLLANGISSPIDYEAIGLFFRMCNFFGSDTPWTRIKAIPPDSILTADERGVRITGGAWQGRLASSTLTRRQAIDGFIERVRAAIGLRPPTSNNWVHPLSGGRDSRHLLLELCHQGMKPQEVVTWAPYLGGGGREADAAAGVANALRVPHRRLAPLRSFTSYEFEKNLDTGFCAPDHFFFIPLREYLVGRTDCVHDGIAGDVLSQDSFMTAGRMKMFAEGRFRDLALDHFATLGMPERSIRWLVGEEAYRQMPVESSIARFEQSCEPFRGADRGYTLWTFFTRTTRMVGLAPCHLYREIPTVYSPYLDREVFDYMTSLPAEFVSSGDFHDEAIGRAFPEYAGLPYAQSPSSKVKYRLPASEQLATLRDLASMSGRHIPRRLSSLARWVVSSWWAGAAEDVPRKWMTYWLQFEAMVAAQERSHTSPLEGRREDSAQRMAASLGLFGAGAGACDGARALDLKAPL